MQSCQVSFNQRTTWNQPATTYAFSHWHGKKFKKVLGITLGMAEEVRPINGRIGMSQILFMTSSLSKYSTRAFLFLGQMHLAQIVASAVFAPQRVPLQLRSPEPPISRPIPSHPTLRGAASPLYPLPPRARPTFHSHTLVYQR